MQYVKLFALLLLIWGFTQCNNKASNAEASTALRFEGRSFGKQSSTCDTDSMRCAKAEITYPEAVVGDPVVMQAVNDTIHYYVRASLALGEGFPETIEEGVDSFIQSYETYILEDSIYITPWEVQTNGKVLYQSPKYISIEITNYTYTGGAHPNAYVNLLTFDANTGRKLQLTDLVSDTAKLKEMVEMKFKEARELPATANLIEEGFFWDGVFMLPANIAVTNEGLYFMYNPYEAAAYAAGPTEFTISYDALKGILKE